MQWSGASRARYSVWCTGPGSIVPHLTGGDRVLQRRSEGAYGRSHRPKHSMGSLCDGTGVWCSGAAPQEPGTPFNAPGVARLCPI